MLYYFKLNDSAEKPQELLVAQVHREYSVLSDSLGKMVDIL